MSWRSVGSLYVIHNALEAINMKKCPVLFFMLLCLLQSVAQAKTTGEAGDSGPICKMQPSLSVRVVISTDGTYPSVGSGSVTGNVLGFAYYFAGDFAPYKSVTANGQVLPINSNPSLFSVLGLAYEGSTYPNFALPNLGGIAIIGTGTGSGLSSYALGVSTGSENVSLRTEQLPAHAHSLASGKTTEMTGSNQAFDTMQPSLPMTRLIATRGNMPERSGSTAHATFIGQVTTFAGNFAPEGWMVADGSVLSIAENEDLFSVIGAKFGGDGETTFALPDLRGRVSVGADKAHPVGTVFGQESTTLTIDQLPEHDHSLEDGGSTGMTGLGQPVDLDQPSLALTYLVAISGTFPTEGGSGFDADTPVIGQISEFAGDYAPAGWKIADGSYLYQSSYQALYNILGEKYGGTAYAFKLPDFRGRTLLGTSNDYPAGTTVGSEQTTITLEFLPSHTHALSKPAANPALAPTLMLLLNDSNT